MSGLHQRTVTVHGQPLHLYSHDGRVWVSDLTELPRLAARARLLEQGIAPSGFMGKQAARWQTAVAEHERDGHSQ